MSELIIYSLTQLTIYPTICITGSSPTIHTHDIFIYIYMLLYALYISYHIHICVFHTFTNIPLLCISRGVFNKQHTPGISRPYTYFSRIHNSSRGGVRANITYWTSQYYLSAILDSILFYRTVMI